MMIIIIIIILQNVFFVHSAQFYTDSFLCDAFRFSQMRDKNEIKWRLL